MMTGLRAVCDCAGVCRVFSQGEWGGGGVEQKGVHRIWERAIFEVASHGCKDQHAGYHLALLPASRHHPSSRHLTAH